MSAKWIRSKKWDEQHLTGALVPVRWLLRTFSGIPLAVVLLTLVSLYGILASVPIGLIALAPTWALYGLTAAGTVLAGSVAPVWLGGKLMRRAGLPAAARFALSLLALIGLVVISSFA